MYEICLINKEGKKFTKTFDNEFLFSFLSHTDLEIKKITNIYFGVIDQLFNIKYKYLKNLSLAIADALGRNEYAECARKLESDYLPKYNKMFNSFFIFFSFNYFYIYIY